jgi:hypothetical protein
MSSADSLYTRVLEQVPRKFLVEEDPTSVIETSQGDEHVIDPAAMPHKAKVASVTRDNLWRSADAHPVVLDLVMLQKYDIAWLGYEIETIARLIREDFHTTSVADVNLEKLQACKALHLVDDFWSRWEVFLHCLSAFNGGLADFHHMQVPTVAECMVAVDIANRLRDDMAWSDEIKLYLGVVHQHDSELVPQEPLQFVQVPTEHLLVDVEEVNRRWPLIRAAGQAPRGDSVEDVQLRKMLGSWVYLEAMRSRLQSQLVVLNDV